VFAALQALAVMYPNRPAVQPVLEMTERIGWGLAPFIKPILQLALVLVIWIEAGRRLGIISDQMTLSGSYGLIIESASIQAVIAIIIVVAVSISALAGIGDTPVLKDLALVVVGFYFGTRRSKIEAEAASSVTPPPISARGLTGNPRAAFTCPRRQVARAKNF
jgi:hypothetical protein